MKGYNPIKLYLIQYEKQLLSDDENVVKDALQQIFEEYTDHNLKFAGNEIVRFEKILSGLVKSKSKKIRKWAYHCVAICDKWTHSKSDSLIKKTIGGLKTYELSNDSIDARQADNTLWGLIAIANHFQDESVKKFLSKYYDLLERDISRDFISNASILFGYPEKQIDVKGVIDGNRKPELLTLSHVFGYKGYLRGERKSWVTDRAIRCLLKHESEQIREIGYWAFARNPQTDSIPDILKQVPDIDFGVRKWQLALQVKEGDVDFVKERLLELSDPKFSDEQRYQLNNGIIRGLFLDDFRIELVEPIREWFFEENHIQTKLSLLKYMLKYWDEEESGFEFRQVLDWALEQKEYRDYVIQSIKSDRSIGLKYDEKNNRVESIAQLNKDQIAIETLIGQIITENVGINPQPNHYEENENMKNKSSENNNKENATVGIQNLAVLGNAQIGNNNTQYNTSDHICSVDEIIAEYEKIRNSLPFAAAQQISKTDDAIKEYKKDGSKSNKEKLKEAFSNLMEVIKTVNLAQSLISLIKNMK